MTAREMFKENKPKGKILKCSKGRYDNARNTFAYCICDDGQKYNIKVLSDVHPREYSVDYGEKTNVDTLENAILYNEWRARVIANKNDEECL
jgi:hypothetical protein